MPNICHTLIYDCKTYLLYDIHLCHCMTLYAMSLCHIRLQYYMTYMYDIYLYMTYIRLLTLTHRIHGIYHMQTYIIHAIYHMPNICHTLIYVTNINSYNIRLLTLPNMFHIQIYVTNICQIDMIYFCVIIRLPYYMTYICDISCNDTQICHCMTYVIV